MQKKVHRFKSNHPAQNSNPSVKTKQKKQQNKNLNTKPHTLNLIEEKVGNSFEYIGAREDLKRMPIAQVA